MGSVSSDTTTTWTKRTMPCRQDIGHLWQQRGQRWARTIVVFPCTNLRAAPHQAFCDLPQGHNGAHHTSFTCETIRCKQPVVMVIGKEV